MAADLAGTPRGFARPYGGVRGGDCRSTALLWTAREQVALANARQDIPLRRFTNAAAGIRTCRVAVVRYRVKFPIVWTGFGGS